ncbi:hypothetical protein KEM54_001931 [Ascosphaera aggregata]|nr:hypothetical protein KEM54_001931 [Ascosphaera aggregata]
MHIFTLYSLMALLPATIQGLQLKERSPNSSPAVVALGFEKHKVPKNKADKRKRKDKFFAEELINENTDNHRKTQAVLYNAEISLGTPGQKVQAQVDTGSSDLWVNSPDSKICSKKVNPCKQSGTFDKSKSKTYEKINSSFNITYVDGSGASGDYGTDVFEFGGMKLDKLQFGLGLQSTSENCVLGIGYPENEVYVLRTGNKPYPNLPQALVDSGLINSRAYSLYLDDFRSDKGQILFGGIDTEKFEGELQTVPLVRPSDGVYVEFAIDLTGIRIKVGDKEKDVMRGALPVVLDSGSTFSNIPAKILFAMNNRLDGFYDPHLGIDVVPCSAQSSEDYMTYSFSDAEIRVPLNELIIDPSVLGSGKLTDNNGRNMCIFGIAPLERNDQQAILGDTFLRSAYIVYDLDNNEVSLANAIMNSTKSNILEIGKGSKAVPSAAAVTSPVTTGDISTSGSVHGPYGPSETGDQTANAAMPGPTGRPEQLSASLVGLAGAGIVFAALL